MDDFWDYGKLDKIQFPELPKKKVQIKLMIFCNDSTNLPSDFTVQTSYLVVRLLDLKKVVKTYGHKSFVQLVFKN